MNIPELARLVTRRTGIAVRDEHHTSLRSAVRRAGSGSLDRVIDEFTVKETWFYRDDAHLRALPWQQFLADAHARGEGHVSVWSAACATGEEAYTLALLACEAFESSQPPVRVYASDISRSAIEQAAAGRYRARSVRAVPAPVRSESFRVDGDELVLAPGVRALVELGTHNLVDGGEPPFGGGRFDVVVCRNVLIYFDAETAAAVVARLRASLHEGGRLVLGAADELCVQPQPAPVSPQRRRPRTRRIRAAVDPTPRELYELALARLDAGDVASGVTALRRSLYLDPTFALAAFQLACAHDRTGDAPAAARLYRQALNALDPDDARYADLFGAVDVGDVAAACRSRLVTRRSAHAQ